MVAFASADTTSPVNVVVKTGVAVNNSLPANSEGWKAKVNVADVALNKVTTIGTGLQIEFQSSTGTPVDVTNFKVARAEFTLIQNGVTVWNNVPLGSYHPVAQGSPDYYVYNASNANVTPVSGFVAGYLGDNSGATVPVVSKFQVLDQTITLGTADRPLLTASGQYYSLVYNIVFSYVYDGVAYTKTLTPVETEMLVRVTEGLLPSSSPCLIQLQVSDDLSKWVVASNVMIPSPRPTLQQHLNTINLVPATTVVPGLNTNLNRFYRYAQIPITSP